MIESQLIWTAVLFWASQKEMAPRYAVSSTKLLAEITDETPRLKLLWDDAEIENVYSVDILIWNAGRDYIDNQRISDTDPIRVNYADGVKVLYTNFSKTTFPISTSDMRFADLPVTNNQNLSGLQPRNKCFSSYFG